MASLVRRIINTPLAPKAIGPYSGKKTRWKLKRMHKCSLRALHCNMSQAVIVDNTMYISGQIGLDPSSGKLVSGGIVAETKQALQNMGKILESAGLNFTNVMKCTVLMANMNDFSQMNNIYKDFFSSNFPARAAYQVAALPLGAQVEIEAIAAVGKIKDEPQ